MRSDSSGRGWARQAAALLLGSILAGTCAILGAAQKGNSVAQGAAAEIGQKVPGPSGGPKLPRPDDIGQYAVEDPTQAKLEREQRKLRFDRMKEQAGQLAEMARSLQEDIEKSNPNILSVAVTEKARKIEKLAGKIRSEARF